MQCSWCTNCSSGFWSSCAHWWPARANSSRCLDASSGSSSGPGAQCLETLFSSLQRFFQPGPRARPLHLTTSSDSSPHRRRQGGRQGGQSDSAPSLRARASSMSSSSMCVCLPRYQFQSCPNCKVQHAYILPLLQTINSVFRLAGGQAIQALDRHMYRVLPTHRSSWPCNPATCVCVCVCVCQGINSNHAQSARFNTPTSYHYCKPSVLCSALHGGRPYRPWIAIQAICTGCCQHTAAPGPATQPRVCVCVCDAQSFQQAP